MFKFKEKKDFVAIAKEVAWKHGDKHSYIQMDDWSPHPWVVEAMEKAYTQGLEDCRKIQEGDK